MTQSDRTETIREITFKGEFTVREEIRPSLDDEDPGDTTQPKPLPRPPLGFRADTPQSDICCLNDFLRRSTELL